MRIGQNPAKFGIPAYSPKPIGIGILVHIPSEDGYFQDLLKILWLQILSIYKSTREFDLCLFDNGSSSIVKERLRQMQEKGWITWLFLSNQNLGKVAAINWILNGLPNEWIVYADGDVLFRPGWWEATQKIFSAFPEAGIVTAQPAFSDIMDGAWQTLSTLQSNQKYSISEVQIDPDVIQEYTEGLGREIRELSYLKTHLPRLQSSDDETAIWGSSHMQFTIRKSLATKLVPIPTTLALNAYEDRELHRRMDELGFFPLSTEANYVYHMGNHIDESLLNKVRSIGIEPDNALKADIEIQKEFKSSETRFIGLKILKALDFIPGVRKMYRIVYNSLYLYFAEEKR